MSVRACARVCIMCLCACVRACVYVCVYVRVCVRVYDHLTIISLWSSLKSGGITVDS